MNAPCTKRMEVSAEFGRRSPTHRLARYIVEADFTDIPRDVIQAVKAHLLDSLGCIIGGTRLEPSRTVISFFAEIGGVAECTVLGTRTRLPAPQAAYVNAYLNNVLDFDDTYLRRGHPAAGVIPAALAVAERAASTGQELLHAIVIGYEVSVRLGGAIMATPERYRQVSGLSTWQIFGAIAAASKLLHLDITQTLHALGLGGVNAPVPSVQKFGLEASERPLGWIKNNYGWAAMGAVIGCLLAERGFQGNRYLLDGERGFWVMAGSDRCDVETITAGLGCEFLLPKTGFKPYACCRWTHTALDAIREITARHALDTSRIARIDVYTFGELVDKFWGARPANIFDAQYNVPYVIALELLDRSPRFGLSEHDLEDPSISALAAKVTLHADPDADRRFFERALIPSRVVVTEVDGRRLEAYAEVPTGGPGGSPFTADNLRDKFYSLVRPVIGDKHARTLEDVVMDLESQVTSDLVAQTVPQ